SAVVKAIELSGGKAVAIQADAADVEAVKGAVEKPVATFGPLCVLVNNAGTASPKTFAETTLDEMDRVIDINVRGTLVATQAALKHMKPGGRIIMIGSSLGERVLVPGLVAYSATKGAVKMFSQGLSREVASRGITVNNVQPGPIDTDLNPAAGEWAVPQKAATALGRYGHVDEVAALVACGAGPEASYMTGANRPVEGGMNARATGPGPSPALLFSISAHPCSEAVPVLHQFPVGVLVEYLVAAKLVEVAAAVVQLLAVDAGAGHHPHRDSAVASDERVDVVPAHVGDHAEAIAEHLPDGRLAVRSPPLRLRSACHQERAVVCEERHDPVNIAAVECLVDLFHERGRRTNRHRDLPQAHYRRLRARSYMGYSGSRPEQP